MSTGGPSSRAPVSRSETDTIFQNCFLCPLLVQDRGTQLNVSALRARPAVRVCAAPFNLHPVRMMFVNVNTTDATTGVCVKL
jgi:hypothetical protein